MRVPCILSLAEERDKLTHTVLLAIGITWLAFQFILAPSILPFFMFALYSFWVPQIYRCAMRGSSSGMDKVFILGTAGARLVLPLCKSPLCSLTRSRPASGLRESYARHR